MERTVEGGGRRGELKGEREEENTGEEDRVKEREGGRRGEKEKYEEAGTDRNWQRFRTANKYLGHVV